MNETYAPRRADQFHSVIILSGASSPSHSYYLAPRLSLNPDLDVQCPESPADFTEVEANGTDALLIFCRYAPRRWLRWAASIGRRMGLLWFVDDDFAAITREQSLPRRYRRKVRVEGLEAGRRLLRMGAHMVVATPHLADLWAKARPQLAPPMALLGEPPPRRGGPVVAYHATAAHEVERAWLAPVLRALLQARSDVQVELFADARSARFWQGDPRVVVRPQSPWPVYLEDTRRAARDVLLAPLVPSEVNAARAHTKRIDAARCGAALIVSDAKVYAPTAEERDSGMVLPLDQETWTRGLVVLLSDPQRIRRLAELNRQFLERSRAAAPPLFLPATLDGSGRPRWRLAGT